MTLGQLIREEEIIPALAARDRWGAIDELSERLFTGGLLPLSERDSIQGRLRDREARLTTGIGAGVAIPHALCPHLDHIVAVLGISREGIDFDAIDQAPVHIIVLFVVPERGYRLRLETLSAIGKSLSNPELRKRLLAAETVTEMAAVLCGRPHSGARRPGRAGSAGQAVRPDPSPPPSSVR